MVGVFAAGGGWNVPRAESGKMTASAGTVLFVADPLKLGETAVKWYTMFPLKPTPVYQRHKLPDALQKLAGALYALGRYEECLQLKN